MAVGSNSVPDLSGNGFDLTIGTAGAIETGGIVNLDLVGRVDFADFAIFAENWLWQEE